MGAAAGAAGENLASSPISATVYTSFGQFANFQHSTGSYVKKMPVTQVFQSLNSTGLTPFYVIPGVTESVSKTFYVSVSNTATDNNGAGIMANSYVLINVPPGFTNIANNTS